MMSFGKNFVMIAPNGRREDVVRPFKCSLLYAGRSLVYPKSLGFDKSLKTRYTRETEALL